MKQAVIPTFFTAHNSSEADMSSGRGRHLGLNECRNLNFNITVDLTAKLRLSVCLVAETNHTIFY